VRTLELKSHINFPPFSLDPANQRLWRGAEIISLRPKTFAVLHHLLKRPGQLVTKDELLDGVWPETAVSDAVLKGCIREIRAALGDDPASPQFIETAHRRGYRFIGQVTGGATLPPASAYPRGLTSAPMVGREAELRRLRSLLEKALLGERQVVFVTGEPGIGKTAVVEAFLAQIIAEPSIRIARGQCLEQYGAGEAYLPILEALGRLCRAPDGSRLIALLRRYAPVWLAQMPGIIGPSEREALHREIAGATPERMLREMAEAIEAMTEEAPIVLVLEDLHWSDCSTLDLLSSVAQRPEPARLLVVGTYRPVETALSRHPLKAVKQELQMRRRCEEMPLEYLTEMTVAAYLKARFPQNDYPDELARAIHRRTEGNPLFMVNVLDYLVTIDSVIQHGGQWVLRVGLEEVELAVPENIRQMIEKQIERLSPDEQRALEAASVAGVDFSAVVVAAGLGEDIVQVEQWCEELARRRQFLQSATPSTLPDGTLTTRYQFIHALYQNILYERTPPTRRARLHQWIGERGEMIYGDRASEMAAELAVHFEQGRDYRRAVKFLHQAATNAAQRFAYHEVVALSRKGLELLTMLPDSPESAMQELRLLITLGPILIATKGYGTPEVEQIYARARELCHQVGETPELFSVLWGLGRFYLVRTPLRIARELGEQLLRLADKAQDPELLMEAHNSLGATLSHTGDFALSREHLEQGVTLYDPQRHRSHAFLYGQDPGVVCLIRLSFVLWCLGYQEQGLERSRQALALAREISHPFTLAFALSYAALLHHLRRSAEAAWDAAQSAITLSTEQGFPMFVLMGILVRSSALVERGQAEEAITQLRQGLGAAKAAGAELLQSYGLGVLAHAYRKVGRDEEGLAALAQALDAAHGAGDRFYEAELHRLKGDLLLERFESGNNSQVVAAEPSWLTEAEACFHQAINVARRQQAKSLELRAVMSLSRLYQKQGKKGEARQMLVESYNWFTEGFDSKDLKEAKAHIESVS